MNNTTIFSGIILLLMAASCTPYSYTGKPNRNNKAPKVPTNQQYEEDGKCYAKATVYNSSENNKETIYIFKGNKENTNVDLGTELIEVKPPSTKWIKKKADKNCLSKDPDDCLVWCLVEVPAELESYTVVKDISQTNDYIEKKISREMNNSKDGYFDYVEVICKDEIKGELIQQLCTGLTNKGYTVKTTNEMNSKIRVVLKKFQKDQNLPVGPLSIATLDALGINF